MRTVPFKHPTSPMPFIFSGEDISALLGTARRLEPAKTLKPHTSATLIGLLHATGMRISEALHLTLEDVHEQPHRLFIADTKFGKDRWVVLKDRVVLALETYLEARRSFAPKWVRPAIVPQSKRPGAILRLGPKHVSGAPRRMWHRTRYSRSQAKAAQPKSHFRDELLGGMVSRRYRPQSISAPSGDLYGSSGSGLDPGLPPSHPRTAGDRLSTASRLFFFNTFHSRRKPMIGTHTLGGFIISFFQTYLAAQRGVAANTIANYVITIK